MRTDGRRVRLAHDAVLGKLAAGARGRAGEPRVLSGARRGRGRAAALADARACEGPADPAGVPLAEAEKLVADFRHELPADLTAYVTASRNRARRRQRLVASAAVFFACLAAAATGASILAFLKQREAVAAERRALAALDDAANVSRAARTRSSRAANDLRIKIDELRDWAPPSWSAYLFRERAGTYSDLGVLDKNRDDLDASLQVRARPQIVAGLEQRQPYRDGRCRRRRARCPESDCDLPEASRRSRQSDHRRSDVAKLRGLRSLRSMRPCWTRNPSSTTSKPLLHRISRSSFGDSDSRSAIPISCSHSAISRLLSLP